MQVVTSADMKKMDKAAFEVYGIPNLLLMDQAAKEVAKVVEEEMTDKAGLVVIFVGKGNNGGDGIGAARWLLNKGFKVRTFLVGSGPAAVAGEAAAELNMFLKAGGQLELLLKDTDLKAAYLAVKEAELVVDGLLGTGFSGELRPLYKMVCQLMNDCAKKVVAIDIPSGVNADNGRAEEGAVKATVTVTMAMLKPGLLFEPGRSLAGRVVLADIGMPPVLKEMAEGKLYLLTEQIVKELLPLRKPDAHKGDAGRVTVVAGSYGYVGAAALAAHSAVKAGAGLVTLLTGESSREILSIKLTEVMVKGLAEEAVGALGPEAMETILQRAEEADAIAIGPGLGTAEATARAIRQLLPQLETPVVIDADGLNALKGHTELLTAMKAPKVLTPHPGEMSRLTGLSIGEINGAPLEVAKEYAEKWQAVVVLKGAPTVIACPEGSLYINSTGCNAMATGGSGDVLTGIIAALAGQGISLQEAALCGVYLHGLAGELATEGTVGLAAGEIAQFLPHALKSIQN